jgi:hypothetical protein
LELKEFILLKEIPKEPIKENLQNNFGILGLLMGLSLKDYTKLPSLVGELNKNVCLKMQKLLIMALNAQFTWINLV